VSSNSHFYGLASDEAEHTVLLSKGIKSPAQADRELIHARELREALHRIFRPSRTRLRSRRTIWHFSTRWFSMPSRNEDWSISQARSNGGTHPQNIWTRLPIVSARWLPNYSDQKVSVAQSGHARGRIADGCFSITPAMAIVASVRTRHADRMQECESSGLCAPIDGAAGDGSLQAAAAAVS